MDIIRERCHRPSAFDKMEGLVREMQHAENGVPVGSQKLFLTSIPSAFMGYDLIEWLMERLSIEESEALNLANQLCQYGYFFPVSDSKNLVVKDDSSLYRFQASLFWPWQKRPPDNIEYAIYLAKRTLRNKQRHGLEEYEVEALNNLRKNLANKWDFITMQAEEQVKKAKEMKKGEKIVSDSQERAYWRVHRPPPGMVNSLEQCPVPTRCRNGNRPRKRTVEDCKREVEMLKNSLSRTRVKVSQALESMVQHVETYSEYDPIITGTQPSNPWVTEDQTFWQLNSAIVDVPTEKRVRRWALSMEELVSDATGLQEFTAYLRKEYSHENIRFWMAVNDLRRSSQSQIQRKVCEIFEEFLAPGAPCEINIDGKTMEKVHNEMRCPSRFTFDAAQEHVYTLLLKKDCYPRFIRSEHYKSLQAAAIQPSQKKRFFNFKKKSTQVPPNPGGITQQHGSQSGGVVTCGTLTKRRGSDRSLSGSAHELAISGVRETRVAHSHSQSNLSDIPYRGDLACGQTGSRGPTVLPKHHQAEIAESPANPEGDHLDDHPPLPPPPPPCRPRRPEVATASTSEEVCPWESRSRKNSAQLDSGSSSSDVSVAAATPASDVSDRFRRQCVLTQQYTLDGDGSRTRAGHSGKKLSATACALEARRASVSAPLALLKDGEKRSPPAVPTAPPAGDSEKFTTEEESAQNKKGAAANLVKTCSVSSGASPPIISVSSATDEPKGGVVIKQVLEKDSEEDADDDDIEEEDVELEELGEKKAEVRIDEGGEDDDVDAEPCCSRTRSSQSSRQPQQMQQLAPLAVPDCESPVSECAPEEESATAAQELSEAKSNDVCPWEDEETCKLDAPFVKTYATLGYL